ncbi:hypothetical protein [Aureimonas sp. Leaf324]|uniref:hypothetical protein n=1 Tax=Aureimonas sp. Leaf324 TaxID=1736336 RepID=UPI0007020836|nr:hypothetical protein [Aureimonas sp. Leaf324]KQQ83639.1 hypothetical protein ASF65_20455 [Aureimonas sp. Leaf324]
MSATTSSTAYDQAFSAGAAAERNRIVGILQSEEGKKRPSAALEMALDETGISADTAGRLLARLPVEGASRGNGPSFTHGAGAKREHLAGLNAAVDALIPKTEANAGGAPGPAPAEASNPRLSRMFAAVDRLTGGPAGSSRS